jgi:putative heme iron utilization protein
VDQLTDIAFLRSKILVSALAIARERKLITVTEEKLLLLAAEKQYAKASDFDPVLPGLNSNQRGYLIRQLVERKMLLPINEKSRKYVIGFGNSYLIRGEDEDRYFKSH